SLYAARVFFNEKPTHRTTQPQAWRCARLCPRRKPAAVLLGVGSRSAVLADAPRQGMGARAMAAARHAAGRMAEAFRGPVPLPGDWHAPCASGDGARARSGPD